MQGHQLQRINSVWWYLIEAFDNIIVTMTYIE